MRFRSFKYRKFYSKSKTFFRNYFNEVCYVSEAEEYFGINEYSDSIVLTKPLVYMTVQEICETHKVYYLLFEIVQL
jgi:hypothetical protein